MNPLKPFFYKSGVLVLGIQLMEVVGNRRILAGEAWKPVKPITVIAPWAAGGSTDQVTRVTAGELEEALGKKVVVVNQPGASGFIGTKSALDAPRDGYTWAAGAVVDLGTYRVQGFLDTQIQDWHLYLTIANVSVVAVNPELPTKPWMICQMHLKQHLVRLRSLQQAVALQEVLPQKPSES